MAASALAFAEADDELWHEYDLLARRAYGQPVEDITRLGAHADRRVALRGGKVVAGGLGMLIPQWFGGRPVPSASMACGCVAPEERGGQLAARLTVERLQPLREQGAVLATLWTASTGYVRRMGWEAPAPVYSWTVPTDELRRRFDESDVEIQHGETAQLPPLRDTLAARWNGTWQRPAWWVDWQQAQHPGLSTSRFGLPGGEPAGVLSVAGEHPGRGAATGGPRLLVDDDGDGVPAEHRSRVFDRFYRVQNDRNRDTGGTGLGLALVAETVRRYGGSARVGETPDDGARFEIRWPVWAAPPRPLDDAVPT